MRYTTKGKTDKVGDQNVINQLSQDVSSAARRMPLLIAFLYYIFKSLIGIAAYVGKILLRKRLGERTFGLITMLFVLLLIYAVRAGVLYWPKLIDAWQTQFADMLLVDKIFGSIYIFIVSPSGETISFLAFWNFIEETIVKEGIGVEGQIFWWLIVVMSLLQFVGLYFRSKRNEIIHSYFRGDSVFWGWLIGKKIGRITINEGTIWRFIDPLFLWLLSYVFAFGGYLEVIPPLLKISAVCLALEEYLTYSENRKIWLDVIDGRLDSAYINTLHAQYEQIASNTNSDNQESSLGNKVID